MQRCSVWQYVAVCDSMLQCVCCGVLQCVTVCNVLQYDAVWCSQMQCVAVTMLCRTTQKNTPTISVGATGWLRAATSRCLDDTQYHVVRCSTSQSLRSVIRCRTIRMLSIHADFLNNSAHVGLFSKSDHTICRVSRAYFFFRICENLIVSNWWKLATSCVLQGTLPSAHVDHWRCATSSWGRPA